jgi:hypothetical protein
MTVCEVGNNGTDYASCPMGGLGDSDAETSDSAVAALDKLLAMTIMHPFNIVWILLKKSMKNISEGFSVELTIDVDVWVMIQYNLIAVNVSEEHAASICRVISTRKMEAIFSSETLVPTCQTTWCHSPDDHNMNL